MKLFTWLGTQRSIRLSRCNIPSHLRAQVESMLCLELVGRSNDYRKTGIASLTENNITILNSELEKHHP